MIQFDQHFSKGWNLQLAVLGRDFFANWTKNSPQTFWQKQCPKNHLSNEQNPGCLGYLGDYTTQLCGDYNKSL